MTPELTRRMIAIDAWFEARQAKPLPLEFYMVALAGEVGEAANLLKKAMRGDFELTYEHDGQRLPTVHTDDLALELADVEIYLRHFARKAGIDLDAAVERKIEVCEKRWGIPRADLCPDCQGRRNDPQQVLPALPASGFRPGGRPAKYCGHAFHREQP